MAPTMEVLPLSFMELVYLGGFKYKWALTFHLMKMLQSALKDEISAKQQSLNRVQNIALRLEFYLLTPVLVILLLHFLPPNSGFPLAIEGTFT